MKKLICVKDVDLVYEQGKNVIYIDKQTIITPAARDAAKEYQIEFSKRAEIPKVAFPDLPKSNNEPNDSEMIYRALKVLMEKGLLNGLMDQLKEPPYVAEKDDGGLKVVRGNTVRLDKCPTSNEAVFYQELLCKNESSMRTGFITIEKSKYEREITEEEVHYIIEGNVAIMVNGKAFNAYPGDVVYVPARSKVIWSSSGQAKLFYSASS